MKRIATALITLSVILLTTTGSVTASPSVEVTRNLTSMPLAFTENQGQWDEQVSFRANAGGATMWFTSDGAVYQFTRTIKVQEYSIVDKRYGMMQGDLMDHQPDRLESIAIKANFVGSNPNPRMVGLDAMEYKCNYFIGNDPNEWHTDVPNYQAIIYEDIYSGIDLKYYGNGKQMEYDFIVSPGADFSQIQIQYEGAESISINSNGELVVETKWGEVVEQRPVIYQIEDNSRIAIAGGYRFRGEKSFGFSLGNTYNPSLPLVIDPVLRYSTYLGGGSSSESGMGIAVDGLGSTYIVGSTRSSNFPVASPFDSSYNWYSDVFVTKLDPEGNNLVYSTYLGGGYRLGGGSDYGSGIAVDGAGSAYITGMTGSTDFPIARPFASSHNGGYLDAFVTKLSPTGDSLVYSTYLGGSSFDWGRGIALDGVGCAYVTGGTQSPDFPTTSPFDDTFNDSGDVFVTKLSPSGDSLVYSTFLGGSSHDQGRSIALDGAGSAYITGSTESPDFPTEEAFQTHRDTTDAFVTKLSPAGDSLVYSTYLAGSGEDHGTGIALDASGSAYITGWTSSPDFPTANPFDSSFSDSGDVFVTKLNPAGNDLLYSTYLGGNGNDRSYGIAVDGAACAYVTGTTTSSDFPTAIPFDGSWYGPLYRDAFVTKLSQAGDSLLYSTYLGANGDDYGYGIALDEVGGVYVTGRTHSSDFPTVNAYDTNYNAHSDAFVAKFEFSDPTNVVEFDPDVLPTHYNMSQSYPNPFNPTTTIEFNLPKRSHVTVRIYNLLGQQVQSLIDQELSVGNYKVTWDGSTSGGGYASTGVYFYRIVTEDFIETKKMVLLK